MPRGDRSGPNGMGPVTGRGAGFCAGYEAPGYANAPAGRGGGRGGGGRAAGGGGFRQGAGRGGGRGFRNRFFTAAAPGWAPAAGAPGYNVAPDATVESDALRQQADALSAQLNAIRERLDALDNSEGK